MRHRREERTFKAMIGGQALISRFPRLSELSEEEKDYRWPQPLIMASQEQARTGRPPNGELEYRAGQYNGGDGPAVLDSS